MSRGYDVSTDSLIHLTILEDSFSPATCSLVANFTGQTKNSFKKFYHFFYWSFFIWFWMKLFYFPKAMCVCVCDWPDGGMTSFLYWGGRQNTLLTTLPPLAWHCRYPLLFPSPLLLSRLQVPMFGAGGRGSDIIYDLCQPYLVPIQSPHTKITRRTGWSWLMSAQYYLVWYQDIFYLISSCLTRSLELSLP